MSVCSVFVVAAVLFSFKIKISRALCVYQKAERTKYFPMIIISNYILIKMDEQGSGFWIEGKKGPLTHNALHETGSLVW